jgi:antitoxin component YwqK of YwqJK toxin-antitoxin module
MSFVLASCRGADKENINPVYRGIYERPHVAHVSGDEYDGLRHGIWVVHDKTNDNKEELNYKDGRLNGLATGWYKNGTKRYEGLYDNDKKTGKWTFWYEDGTIVNEAHYLNGIPCNTWKSWHRNGKLSLEQKYSDGYIILEKSWDENGNPTEIKRNFE